MMTTIRTFRATLLIITCTLLVAANALAAQASPGAPTMLSPQGSDDWEPAVAADASGHVYALWIHQAGGNPTCPMCRTAMLSTSSNYGASWATPVPLTPGAFGNGQFDPQIVVDPMDGKTVYASFLQNTKSSVVVMRSTDAGLTWSAPVEANHTGSNTDKPTLLVRGSDVYVAYSNASKTYVSASHDGGQSFTSVVLGNGTFGCSLSGGGGVDLAGNVYFSWVGYSNCFNSTGSATLYITKSTDQGRSWKNIIIDHSSAAPVCAQCGWQFLGAQLSMTIGKSALGKSTGGKSTGTADTLYVLWNKGTVDLGPEQINFESSSDGGATWSKPQAVSPAGNEAAFPSITTSGAAGDVRVAWMERSNGLWNVRYQKSLSGGSTWTTAVKLSECSTASPACPSATSAGFDFPYGDYFKLAVSGAGQTQVVWGEGLNWTGPGNIWYTSAP
jgi:BNR repeat-like domain